MPNADRDLVHRFNSRSRLWLKGKSLFISEKLPSREFARPEKHANNKVEPNSKPHLSLLQDEAHLEFIFL